MDNSEEPQAGEKTNQLYLYDLHSDVTDGMLYNKFSNFGNIASIKIFHDFGAASESSGFAYINYQNVADAKKAMDALNSTPLINKPLKMKWSFEEKPVLGAPKWPNVQIKVMGIFVYNMDPSISTKDVCNNFSSLGGRSSSYVVIKSLSGVSKTLAFLYFGISHDLDKGLPIGGKNSVLFFTEEQLEAGESILTQGCTTSKLPKKSVMIQNFPDTYTENQLRALLSKYGEITSCHIFTNSGGYSLGGGFVSFVELKSAEAACQELNGTWIRDQKIRLDLVKNIDAYKGMISPEEELLYDKFERRCNAFKRFSVEKSRTTGWKDRTSDSLWFLLLAEVRPSPSSDRDGEVVCF